MKIEEHIPLAPLTTFAIGGSARFFVRATTLTELKEAAAWATEQHVPLLILGGGSNVLISDVGFDGLVIKIELSGIEIQKEEHTVRVIAAAGESWDALVQRACSENVWGLENLSGIPGTVGGAVAGNIGAYGQALSQTLEWVEVYNITTGAVTKLTNAECAFEYRSSVFISKKELVLLRAVFSLSTSPKPDLSYKDLKERFADASLDIQAIRAAVLSIRAGKFPDLALEGTAGSFFKNPIVSSEQAKALTERYPDMPLFMMPETSGTKVPLAWILDKVLALRGKKVGDARLYEKQPLVVVAKKNSSARDVVLLAQEVAHLVAEKIGIEIEKEVKVI